MDWSSYYDPKKSYGCAPEKDDCPNHPDLYLLREAAADERGAIADYLACAIEDCLEVFFDIAEDEMQHFVETMRLISLFDPVQAEMLEEEKLDQLVMKKRVPIKKPKWAPQKMAAEKEDVEITPPEKNELPAVRCLTKAIQDELHAINKYQKFMNQANDYRVKEHFCDLMNEEKEHVAELTATLFRFTHEPLPQEID